MEELKSRHKSNTIGVSFWDEKAKKRDPCTPCSWQKQSPQVTERAGASIIISHSRALTLATGGLTDTNFGEHREFVMQYLW